MTQDTWDKKYKFQMSHEYRIRVTHEYDQKFRFQPDKFAWLYQFSEVLQEKIQNHVNYMSQFVIERF